MQNSKQIPEECVVTLNKHYFKTSLEAKEALNRVQDHEDIEIRMLLDDKKIGAWSRHNKTAPQDPFNITDRVRSFTLKKAFNLTVRQGDKSKSLFGCTRPDYHMRTQYFRPKDLRGPTCSVLQMKLADYPFMIQKPNTQSSNRFYTTNAVSVNKFRSKVVKGNILSKGKAGQGSVKTFLTKRQPKLKKIANSLRINNSAFGFIERSHTELLP